MAVATMHSKRAHRRTRTRKRKQAKRPKRGNKSAHQWREELARTRRKQRARSKKRQPTWQDSHPSNARAS